MLTLCAREAFPNTQACLGSVPRAPPTWHGRAWRLFYQFCFFHVNKLNSKIMFHAINKHHTSYPTIEKKKVYQNQLHTLLKTEVTYMHSKFFYLYPIYLKILLKALRKIRRSLLNSEEEIYVYKKKERGPLRLLKICCTN